MKNREELIKIVGYLAEQKPEEWRMNGEGGPENGNVLSGSWKDTQLSVILLDRERPSIEESANGKTPEDVPNPRGYISNKSDAMYSASRTSIVELTPEETTHLQECFRRGREEKRRRDDEAVISNCWEIITSTMHPTEIAKLKCENYEEA
jgi:hypothetical protein